MCVFVKPSNGNEFPRLQQAQTRSRPIGIDVLYRNLSFDCILLVVKIKFCLFKKKICLFNYSCNSLSKNDAINIINNGHMRHWTCIECITSILPINCTNNNTDSQNKRANASTNSTDLNHKPDPCASCNKTMSSKIGSKVKCPWCSKMCHGACVHNSLGCTSCCTNLIPGYYYDAHELSLGCRTNHRIFNPYNTGLLLNQMSTGPCGNEDDDDDPIHEYITQQLNNCIYTEPKNIKMPKNDELKIMSLNIRSLTKNIDHLRENIDHFKMFDAICINEINCDPATLPNGLNDIKLEGFHNPITQKPYRASNKGGGLAVYINHRVYTKFIVYTFITNISLTNVLYIVYLLTYLMKKLISSVEKIRWICVYFVTTPHIYFSLRC